MIWLIALALVLYQVNDGVCQRELGESCVNSPDCTPCLVSLNVKQNSSLDEITYYFELKNLEPEHVRYYLRAMLNNKLVLSKELELDANESYSGFVRVKLGEKVQKLEIVVKDEFDAVVASETIDVPALQTSKPLPVIPALLSGLLLLASTFIAIKILTAEKEKERQSPYFYVAPYPVVQQPKYAIAVKKKVYYYVPKK